MTLSAAMAPMREIDQWITHDNKVPTNWQTGLPHSAHDPAVWTSYDTAYACGAGSIGFVFTAALGMWFCDLDHCKVNGVWTPLAHEVAETLRGAACEVSVCGDGLHWYGRGEIPAHLNKNTDIGLELYHDKRFAAIGGHEGVYGDANFDCTEGLAKLVDKYLKPVAVTMPGKPVVKIDDDDDDLIQRMLASKSSGGAFGSKATAAQLWSGDVPALSRLWPGDGRPYDCSSADASLAQCLVFWTGGDCDRIERLMRRSALVRDKWDKHKGYMRTTIEKAVARHSGGFYKAPTSPPRNNDVYLSADMQRAIFTGYTYVMDQKKIIMPGGHACDHEQFDMMMGGLFYVLDENNIKTTSSAWEAFQKFKGVPYERVNTSEFRPDKGIGEIWEEDGSRFVNSYYPTSTPRKHGNIEPFLTHVGKLFPNVRDKAIFLSYLAAVVQHVGVKFQWCPVIQGVEGNGKTLFSRCLTAAIGRRHCHSPKASELPEKYNDWMLNKIFISVEDIYVPREKAEVMELLKPMISDNYAEIRSMGTNKITRRVCCNYLINTNHKDALQITDKARRFAMFFTPQQHVEDLERDGMGGDYFHSLYAWLDAGGYAIVADFLLTYTIPNELNPAGACNRAPATTTSFDAIESSRSPFEQEIQAACDEDRPGFRKGWISSTFIAKLIKDNGMKLSRNKWFDMLQGLGYIRHPSMKNGQSSISVSPDQCRPTLYVKKGHSASALSSVEASKMYERDQTEPSVFLSIAGRA